jgi:formylmethanofuran dehydrogenase subunit B
MKPYRNLILHTNDSKRFHLFERRKTLRGRWAQSHLNNKEGFLPSASFQPGYPLFNEEEPSSLKSTKPSVPGIFPVSLG